ncbi:MAG: CHASE2 domain-containing protein [Nitrospirota bacterium]|nr:MAG: CHASE2 domain-containing protein [Nitrospirota bacterium]
MRLPRFVSTNWFIGSTITSIFLIAYLIGLYPLVLAENKMYDLMSRLDSGKGSSHVVLVEIDEKSIEDLGPWPWPRKYFSDALGNLSDKGSKVISLHVPFTSPDINPGLDKIREVRKDIAKKRKRSKNNIYSAIYADIRKAERESDHDTMLTRAAKAAGNVLLSLNVRIGEPSGSNDKKIPVYLIRNSTIFDNGQLSGSDNKITVKNPFAFNRDRYIFASTISPPFQDLASNAKGMGHISYPEDKDNVIRNAALFISYKGRLYPSLALQSAVRYLGQDEKHVKQIIGKRGFSGIQIKNLRVPTSERFEMLISFQSSRDVHQRYSFSDLVNDVIPPDIFKGKIVIIGPSSPDLGSLHITSVGEEMSEISIAANIIDNILNETAIMRPLWAYIIEASVLLALGLFVALMIPRLRKRNGSILLGIFVLTWSAICLFLFVGFGIWLKPVTVIMLSIVAFAAVTINRMISSGVLSDAESIESYKMLGLSLQGQGMLDMALEKFMKCPVKDDSVKSLLYNLGLDFERKRMFNKAVAVYEHILKGGKYKDSQERIVRLRPAEEVTAIGTQFLSDERTMILEDTVTRPTLGRYEVVEELGRGAMGTVYLGKDPKINRDVAIKTLKFDHSNEEELSDFKERFFREAEAAGNLAHPNIMTIYDIGEEHDMAYIAMELLKGRELSEFTSHENLLPIEEVLNIISSVAEALDYAHSNGVVHRDIKPANIMILGDGTVKVADFGIAALSAAAETHTGTQTVVGTPNYMSPEQISGKKVDGRSDLFSLGCVLYEMLTGEKPFKGDNLGELLRNIQKGDYHSPEDVRPDLPKCCVEITNKLLSKALKKRYKNGKEIADDIRKCIQKVN